MMYRALLGAAALAIGGCGLVDSDVTNFDISLPQKTLTVDTAQWQLTSEANFPAVDCSGNEQVCAATQGDFCGSDDCAASCDGSNCQLTIAIDLFKDFDLASENPALQDLDDMALISVSIDKIFFQVSANTLNIDTPPMGVYIAPMTVMSPSDDGAIRFGEIPAVVAGTTLAEAELILDEDGEQTVQSFLEDWSTPFNIIVAADVVVAAGDPVPTGALDAAVRVNATAGID
ncbi:MAG: hypothetical protein KJO07_18910 [Deltaproteobacteria bacterium]|nr:hypothetical protein [Deltaproteobacteria bacterium]